MSGSSWEDVPFVANRFRVTLFGMGEPTEVSDDDIEKQRAHHESWVRTWKEWTAIGDLNYPTVPRYDPTEGCRKCGESRHKVQHCTEYSNEICCKAVGRREHLHVYCKRCRHDRIRRVVQEEL